MLLLILLTVTLTECSTVSPFPDPGESVYDDQSGTCTRYVYEFYENMSFKKARDHCEDTYTAALALIDTLPKYKHVRAYLKGLIPTGKGSDFRGFWVGADDKTSEGDFVWRNGAALDYDRWARRQPSNSKKHSRKGQDCLQIWIHRKKNKHLFFDDNYCFRKQNIICSWEYPC